MAEKATLLVIGPTPPPHHGVSVAMAALLGPEVAARFRVVHLDLADRRGIQHVDRPDLHDVHLFIRQWISLVRLLIRERPRIVYLPISQTALGVIRDSLLLWPALLQGSRAVLHLHGGNFRCWYDRRGPLLRGYVRLLLNRTARLIVLGESLRTLFDGLVGRDRISVIANGVPKAGRDLPPFRRAPKGAAYRILHLGTLSRLKGTFVLLAAISRVLRERRDVEFVFAGGWLREAERREAARFVEKEGLAGAVVFTGHVEGVEKEALYHSADLFVFPGIQQEGQPLVVLEAMAAGLPVLFTGRGCLRETVVEGESGLEAAIDDPEDLSKKMLALLDRPEEMNRMGREAEARHRKHYTIERFTEEMVRLFSRVAGEKRGGLEE